jgi:hypothetical protein
MGQVYQCWWRICREINVFLSRFEYHMFYVLYQFVAYLLTLPRTYKSNEHEARISYARKLFISHTTNDKMYIF